MNVHAAGDLKFTGLTRPDGAPLRLNAQDFVAIDRDRNAKFEPTYRPQALYNRANEGFHANNETFLLHEVATNLPIYLPDTGPTDFHLHLPPGGAWSHPRHDRPLDAGFWLQDPLALDALFKPLTDSPVKSSMPVFVRDIGIEAPSGHLVTGHIIATDPRGQSLLPKSTSAAA